MYQIDIHDMLQGWYSTDNLATRQLGSLGDFDFTALVSSTALTAFYSDSLTAGLAKTETAQGYVCTMGPRHHAYGVALFPTVGSQCFAPAIVHGTNGNAGFSCAWQDSLGLGIMCVFDEE